MKKNELSNDKIYILLFDYLIQRQRQEGSLPESAVVLKSIWTNDIVADIAAEYQIRCITISPDDECEENTLSKVMEKEGGNIVFDFYQRRNWMQRMSEADRQLVEEMKQEYESKKRSLCSALKDLYRKYGYFKAEVVSVYFGRLCGANQFLAIMRGYSPHTLGGYEVLEKRNYEEAEEADSFIMEYQLTNGARVVVHPEWKEKNMHIYITARGESEDIVRHTILNLKSHLSSHKLYR